jgi:hypothetical protein
VSSPNPFGFSRPLACGVCHSIGVNLDGTFDVTFHKGGVVHDGLAKFTAAELQQFAADIVSYVGLPSEAKAPEPETKARVSLDAPPLLNTAEEQAEAAFGSIYDEAAGQGGCGSLYDPAAGAVRLKPNTTTASRRVK